MNTKKIIISMLILVLFVAACSFEAGVAPPPAVATQVSELVDAKSTIQVLENIATAAHINSSPTPTQTLPPNATPTIAPTTLPPLDTATAAAIPKSCLGLIYPPNGEWVRAYGYLLFRWEPWQDAASYRLQITVPTGWVMSVDLESTRQNRYMPTLASEGEYTWRVAALEPNGEVLCQSAPFTFKKQYSRPNIKVGDDCDPDTIASGA